jgi:hypothetical protein
MSDVATGAPLQTPFPFMKLPIELRLRELLLQPESEGDLRMKSSGLHCLHPNILQTCHQVYDEAVEVLYGENVFYINDIDPDKL